MSLKIKYIGDLDENDRACGFGQFVFDGYLFKGTFYNDRCHGLSEYFFRFIDVSLVSQYDLSDKSHYLHAEYKFGKPFGKKTKKRGNMLQNHIYDDTYCAQIDISQTPKDAFYTNQGKT